MNDYLYILILVLIGSFSAIQAQTNSTNPLPDTITAAEAQHFGLPVFKNGVPNFDGANRVAAWVNGYPILETMITQQMSGEEISLGGKFSGKELDAKIVEARQTVLNALISRELIVEDFKSHGGHIPQDYIDERVNGVITKEFGGNRAAFLKTLDDRGVTLEMYGKVIEDTAIVGYMRNKNATVKNWPESLRAGANIQIITQS